MNFPSKLALIVEKIGGQTALSERLGVSRETIRKWGMSRPKENAIRGIASAFSLEPDVLLNDSRDITDENLDLIASGLPCITQSSRDEFLSGVENIRKGSASGNQQHSSREIQLERQIAEANIQRLKDELTDMSEDLERVRKRESELRFAIKAIAGYMVKRGLSPSQSFIDIVEFIRSEKGELDSAVPWISTLMVEMHGWAEKAEKPASFTPKVTEGAGAPPPIFKATPPPGAENKIEGDDNENDQRTPGSKSDIKGRRNRNFQA